MRRLVEAVVKGRVRELAAGWVVVEVGLPLLLVLAEPLLAQLLVPEQPVPWELQELQLVPQEPGQHHLQEVDYPEPSVHAQGVE